jgi:hypothetical protein
MRYLLQYDILTSHIYSFPWASSSGMTLTTRPSFLACFFNLERKISDEDAMMTLDVLFQQTGSLPSFRRRPLLHGPVKDIPIRLIEELLKNIDQHDDNFMRV